MAKITSSQGIKKDGFYWYNGVETIFQWEIIYICKAGREFMVHFFDVDAEMAFNLDVLAGEFISEAVVMPKISR